jgi:hypothetical protein
MFRALLAHLQEALHQRHLVYCVRVMSVDRTRPGVKCSSTPNLEQPTIRREKYSHSLCRIKNCQSCTLLSWNKVVPMDTRWKLLDTVLSFWIAQSEPLFIPHPRTRIFTLQKDLTHQQGFRSFLFFGSTFICDFIRLGAPQFLTFPKGALN